jgi:hypothetical protein
MNMAERVRRGFLKPNVSFDCAICGEHVEKYVPPSEVAKGKARNLYCSRRCKGVAQRGPGHPLWRGGRRVVNGYVLVWAPEHPEARRGYVRKHRIVMANHLGRPLAPGEVVHHENDDTADNRIENLEPESVDLTVTSIPFGSLFMYSGKTEDIGNNQDGTDFVAVDVRAAPPLLREQLSAHKPGTNACIHIQQLVTYRIQHGYMGRRDFRGAVVDVFEPPASSGRARSRSRRTRR